MNNAYEWIDLIMENLFSADKRRIGDLITKLNVANGELKGKPSFGFMHRGKRYIDPRYASQIKALAKQPAPTLDIDLSPQLKNFDRDVAQLEEDQARIKQAITPLIINCNSLQDIRDSLPECIVHLVPDVSHLQRTKQDNTVFIRSDEYAMRAYAKALPLIEAYSVAALIC